MSLVEYHDPDNLFASVLPELSRRLPLTNLHWKAAARPLRSINSLNVEFVPADGQSTKVEDAPTRSVSLSADDREPSGRPSQATNSGRKAQRHQIPGLRETPYLKLLILRCDDKETYKSKIKESIRTWMKENVPAPSTARNAQENHDAFQWLILHVVLPDTLAACESRWSKKPGGSEQELPKERSTTSTRWPGKGSRPILERIRLDFNPPGRSAVDQVAQIRLSKKSVPSHLLPSEPPTGVAPIEETAQEHENACEDVISKMKTLILRSFDQRVGQYEEDIKERENRKSLPGWNFCTFFVLKEGLAKAFESVGLIDDALAVYDELDIGLEATLRELQATTNAQQATSFLTFTPELHKSLIDKNNNENDNSESAESLHINTTLPWNSVNKDYRALIVSNNISIFDFRCYIFTRSMSLLRRIASVRSSLRSSLYPTHENGTVSYQDLPGRNDVQRQPGTVSNAMALAELCRRGVQFVPLIARILRADLRAGSIADDAKVPDIEAIIDNAVLCATFSIAQFILDETMTSDISVSLQNKLSDHLDTAKRPHHRFTRSISHPEPFHVTPSLGKAPVNNPNASTLHVGGLNDIPTLQNQELANAAAYRAELYLLQRRALDNIGKRFSFVIRNGSHDDSKKGDLDCEDYVKDHDSFQGLTHDKLRRSAESAEEFSKFYEALTDRAVVHYAAANRIKSAEKLIVDIAKFKLTEGDYAGAALYFNQILPSISNQGWNSVESSVLQSYAECLKALNRKDEYVRISLALMKNAASARKSRFLQGPSRRSGSIRYKPKATADGRTQAPKADQNAFSELVSFAEQLPYDFNALIDEYFVDLRIDPDIKPFDSHDGFMLRLTVRQLLAEKLTLDKVTLRLINPSDSQAREIQLHSSEVFNLGTEESEIWLQTQENANGAFIVEKVTFQAGKIIFAHEPLKNKEPANILTLPSDTNTSLNRSARGAPILLYQRPGALFATVRSSKVTHIGQKRSVIVILEPGLNEITGSSLVLRSATAGLRLHCGDAEALESTVEIIDKTQLGKLKLGRLEPGLEARIQVPFELERNMAELSVRLELHYRTSDGEFVFTSSPVIPIELAIDINVQDMFKEKYFYAKFLVQPQGSIPISLVGAEMNGSELYEAKPLLREFEPYFVYPRQPSHVTYRIKKKRTGDQGTGTKRPSLLLAIWYRSLQEDVLARLLSLLDKDLDGSPFHHLKRLLLLALEKGLRLNFNHQEYENVALTGQIHTPAFAIPLWSEVVDGLRESRRQDLRQWLEQWHKSNSSVPLTDPNAPPTTITSSSAPHKVLIDFALPHLKYLHVASITLPDHPRNDTDPDHAPLATVGAPLHARLHTHHTRRWDLHLDPGAQPAPPPEEPFIYSIHADAADWLVLGPRRARFAAAPDEPAPRAFDLSLVPVRSGRLALPAVEIVPAGDEGGEASDGDAADTAAAPPPTDARSGRASCETDCTSAHAFVTAVEASTSTTVGVGRGDDLQGDVVLLGGSTAGDAQGVAG